MIWYYIILFITQLLTTVFSWLPSITMLPTIGGVDVDTYLVQAVGFFYSFTSAFWPIGDLYQGVMVYVGYLTIKMVLKFIIGHRAPH